ncbi:hypothetical protein GZH53_16815 [Flavihumibacter sp. R14]|nr:hypothetical protein [Flavihumibacter soli]
MPLLAFILLLFLAITTSCNKDDSKRLISNSVDRDELKMMDGSAASHGVLLTSSFEEENDLRSWQFEANPGALTRSSEVAKSGNYSAKFSISKKDALVSGSHRAEIKTAHLPKEAERWYSLSVYLPSSYSNDPVPESIFQWHNVPNFKSGESWGKYKFQNPWRLETNNGRLVFVHQYNTVASNPNSPVNSKAYDLGEYKLNEWMDFVIHFKATHTAEGIFELWKNGTKMMTITGPGVYYNDETGPYMKLGIYKWGWSGTGSRVNNRTLYIDDIKIGDENSSYNDIAPLNSRKADGALLPVVFALYTGEHAYTAKNGITYQADDYYSGGNIFRTSDTIGGTSDDVLYQNERYGSFSYAVPLKNGTYEITFKFAEIYHNRTKARQFDLSLEGLEVISNLDIVETAGSKEALDIIKTVTVNDGVLNIDSHTDIDNAKLSAFHIIKK